MRNRFACHPFKKLSRVDEHLHDFIQGRVQLGLEQAAVKEVVGLHVFFQEWFNGELPDTDEAFARFNDSFAEDFQMVVPSGNTVLFSGLKQSLRAAHGRDKTRGGIRIWIENAAARKISPGAYMVQYQEWQQLVGAEKKGRISTAIFREKPSEGRDAGLEWVGVHETWLPGPET
mmetsp:Transcript_42167/g.84507  ORF Transcript_42167/g.84507 Transcript_42167/m.84507 type:complete len:174 (-) Transcript_42167:74-595(-)